MLNKKGGPKSSFKFYKTIKLKFKNLIHLKENSKFVLNTIIKMKKMSMIKSKQNFQLPILVNWFLFFKGRFTNFDPAVQQDRALIQIQTKNIKTVLNTIS